jgi:protein-disulfide isomerase
MLKKSALLALLCVSPTLCVGAAPFEASEGMEVSVVNQWIMDTNPIAFVQSLDNKKVFVLGSDAKVHIYTVEGKKLGEFNVDNNVTGIDIAPRGEMIYLISREGKSYTAVTWSQTQKVDITGSPVKGDATAPVTMVIFSDFECPYCKQVEPLLEQVFQKNTDKLKVVFKHFPLRIHLFSESAALAAIAAQKQGKFWEMHDELFKSKPLNEQTIEAAAKKVGLDMEQYKKDLTDMQTRQAMDKDMLDAQKADVTGTPTIFINGRPVKDRSPAAMQQLIDEEYAKAKGN